MRKILRNYRFYVANQFLSKKWCFCGKRFRKFCKFSKSDTPSVFCDIKPIIPKYYLFSEKIFL